jgi:3',5'-cyclic-AMP phosphodiesterase
MVGRFVHLSDLHFGSLDTLEECTASFVRRIVEEEIGHVVVTGDVTHRGRESEYEAFLDAFSPLMRTRCLTVIPGNHDRAGDDVAASIMQGQRVQIEVSSGVYMVKVDSTGPHNRHAFRAHGMMTCEDLNAIDDAITEAPRDHLVCLLMHHHPYPLPEEGPLEVLASLVGLPYPAEIDIGGDLLRTIVGRCDLLLHGHRHVPRQRILGPASPRPLGIYNAGSSVEMGWARIFEHDGARLTRKPRWLRADPVRQARPADSLHFASSPGVGRGTHVDGPTLGAV